MNQTFFSFFVPGSDTSKVWTGISMEANRIAFIILQQFLSVRDRCANNT
jgi:hypothetical protein